MDSFALRQPSELGTLKVIELDHPTTQAVKRRRLASIGDEVTGDVDLVAVDFETESVAEALEGSAYDPAARAVFCWMGVTYYLTEETVYSALASMASCCAPGSELVFDYQVPAGSIDEQDSGVLRRLDWLVAKVGEPVIAELDPNELSERLNRIGFVVVADLSARVLDQMYFEHREAGLRVPNGMRVMHVRYAGP